MLRIPCPYCGTRDEAEFTFGGSSHLTRPPPHVDDESWSVYLFFRSNPAGVHFERWLHSYGCGRWFNLARDTRTHRIFMNYQMGDPAPEVSGDA